MIHVVSLVLFATGLFQAAFHPIRRDGSEILTAVAGIDLSHRSLGEGG